MSFKEDVLNLYTEYKSVYGPYSRPDGRQHIILRRGNFKNSPQKTLSYPKALLEIKLGRKLEQNETADHDDEVKTNNNIENIKLLTRAENARKSMLHSNRKTKMVSCVCAWCGEVFERPLRTIRRNQEKRNCQGPFCTKLCARKYQIH